MSDISINLHLVWFWLGFVLGIAGWIVNRARPRDTLRARLSWMVVILTAPVGGIVAGVLVWIAAAMLGGWW